MSRAASSTSWWCHSPTLPHQVGRWQVHHRTARPHFHGGGFSHEDRRLQLSPPARSFYHDGHTIPQSFYISCHLNKGATRIKAVSMTASTVTSSDRRRHTSRQVLAPTPIQGERNLSAPRTRQGRLLTCRRVCRSGSGHIFFPSQGPCHLCIK